MANDVGAHWRDSARPLRFFIIDYRATFPIVLFFLHIRWWSFWLMLVLVIFFSIIDRYGFTVPVFMRWLRGLFAGRHKFSRPWWKQ